MRDNESTDFGSPPASGWAKIVAELYVSDINQSRAFWCDLLGFRVAYQRPQERFVYLENAEGAQVMLYQPPEYGQAHDAAATHPKSMLQIFVSELAPILSALTRANWVLHQGPEEVWRRWGDRMGGKREIRFKDPDGHMILVAEDIGERSI